MISIANQIKNGYRKSNTVRINTKRIQKKKPKSDTKKGSKEIKSNNFYIKLQFKINKRMSNINNKKQQRIIKSNQSKLDALKRYITACM